LLGAQLVLLKGGAFGLANEYVAMSIELC